MQDNEINDIEGVGVSPSESDSRVYEIGYLLVPTLKEEEAPVAYNSLKDLITSLGGQAISDEMPIMTQLAYTMDKVIQNVHHRYDNAYFGWMKFFMDPDKVLELKKKLDLDVNIIRFLLIKTVKENTIASKRFMKGDIRKRATVITKTEDPAVKIEEETTINKEELDKEIDAMVEED